MTPSWKALNDNNRDPNYNPYHPLIEEDEEEADEDEQEEKEESKRTKMTTPAYKENFLKLMSYEDDQPIGADYKATNNHDLPAPSTNHAVNNHESPASSANVVTRFFSQSTNTLKHNTPHETSDEFSQTEQMIENEFNIQFSNKYAPRNLTWIPECKHVERERG
jgi:hypothetical protein